MSMLQELHDEIQDRKQAVLEILRYRLLDEQINKLCARFVNAPAGTDLQQQLDDEGYSPECFYAMVSLRELMYLQRFVPTSDCTLSAEGTADFIMRGLYAGLFLSEAGNKSAEKHAVVRLSMLRAQPATRNTKKIEKEDIEAQFDFYKSDKGVPPPSLARFLTYLGVKGYDIDKARKTVTTLPGSDVSWLRPKSFGTIDNWLRELKK